MPGEFREARSETHEGEARSGHETGHGSTVDRGMDFEAQGG
jgi:hypothetical protein